MFDVQAEYVPGVAGLRIAEHAFATLDFSHVTDSIQDYRAVGGVKFFPEFQLITPCLPLLFFRAAETVLVSLPSRPVHRFQ